LIVQEGFHFTLVLQACICHALIKLTPTPGYLIILYHANTQQLTVQCIIL
jgi:hypothetical protein